MSWKSGAHACFLTLSSLLTIACQLTYGQTFPVSAADKVVSVAPDLAHGSITISTNSKNPLPAPQIQYLPGPDGKTLLVADFEGVSYQLATHLLKPENLALDAWRQNGIQEIRIGQFSSQPPTMRISIGAFNAKAFRTIAFHARPGALIMKWTPGAPAQATHPNATGNHALQSNKAADNTNRRIKKLPLSASQEPIAVAPVAPDYRKAQEQVSTYSTTIGAKPAKDVSVRSVKKTLAAPEIKAQKLPDMQDPENKKWIAPNSSPSGIWEAKRQTKTPGEVLYKSTGATVPQNSAIEEPKFNEEKGGQKPPSAVARWLKLNFPSSRTSETSSESANKSNSVKPAPSFDPNSKTEYASAAPDTEVSNEMRDAGQVTVTVNDVDQLRDNGATDVLVKADKKLNYKIFRLHEPERYVIDFDGLPALQTAQLPSLADELLLKGMRTGTPDDTGLTHRLVLDLKDNTVDVADDLVENGMGLSLKIRPSSSSPLPVGLKAGLVKDKLIVLDAGHGGSDPGAQRSGVSEKDLTLQITNQLKKRLTQMGARVVMTRTDDTFVSLEDRVKITNEKQPDLFVSIHINALESTSNIYGIETYYQTEQSRALANAIHQQLVQGLGVPDRSVRKARFYVINHTPVPAILAEVGFISNPQERDNLGSADYQAKIADSVSAGITQFLTEKQELAGKSVKSSF
jgi:N-acetylmuramoyl-L-alanine amidase CwlD